MNRGDRMGQGNGRIAGDRGYADGTASRLRFTGDLGVVKGAFGREVQPGRDRDSKLAGEAPPAAGTGVRDLQGHRIENPFVGHVGLESGELGDVRSPASSMPISLAQAVTSG